MHRKSWHKSAKSEITILLSDLSLILTPVALTSSSAIFTQELMDGTRLSTAIETAQGTQGFDLQATLELLAKHACVTSIDESKT